MERINVLKFNDPNIRNRIYMEDVVEVDSVKYELFISDFSGEHHCNDYDSLSESSKFVTNCTVLKDSEGIWITDFDDNHELINRMLEDLYTIETLFFGTMSDNTYVKEAKLSSLFLEVRKGMNPTKTFRKYKLMELDNEV